MKFPDHLQKSLDAALALLESGEGDKIISEYIARQERRAIRYEQIKKDICRIITENDLTLDSNINHYDLSQFDEYSIEDLHIFMDCIFDDESNITSRYNDANCYFPNDIIELGTLGIKAFIMFGQGSYIRITKLNNNDVGFDIDEYRIVLSNN